MNFQEVGREIPSLYLSQGLPESFRVFQGLYKGVMNGSDAPLLVR